MLAIALAACASRRRNIAWRPNRSCTSCYVNVDTIITQGLVTEGFGILKGLNVRRQIKPTVNMLMLTAPPPPQPPQPADVVQNPNETNKKKKNKTNCKKKKKKYRKRKKGGKSHIDEDAAMQTRSLAPNGEQHLSLEQPSDDTTKDWRRQYALLKKFVVQEKTKWKGKIGDLKNECSSYIKQLENIEKFLAMRTDENTELDGQLRHANKVIYCMEIDSRSYERHILSLTNTNTQIFFQSMELREKLGIQSKQLNRAVKKLNTTTEDLEEHTRRALANEERLLAVIQELQSDKTDLQKQLEESVQKNADSSLSSSVESFQEYDTQSHTNLLKSKQKKNNNNKSGKKKKKSKRGGRKRGGYNYNNNNNNNNNTNTLEKEAFTSSSTEGIAAKSESDIELLEEVKVNDEDDEVESQTEETFGLQELFYGPLETVPINNNINENNHEVFPQYTLW